jgi:predicted nucleic acid-binding protein
MMAGPFVIDASVFLNAFNPMESGSEISNEVLARLQSQSIPVIAPFLLLPETAAAISRGTNNSELAAQFASTLLHLPHLILISLDRALAQQALMIASNHRLRGGDSVYTAVAQRFACPLITLDKEQHERAASVLATYYPSELLSTLATD